MAATLSELIVSKASRLVGSVRFEGVFMNVYLFF